MIKIGSIIVNYDFLMFDFDFLKVSSLIVDFTSL
jgi:hypothetical protein